MSVTDLEENEFKILLEDPLLPKVLIAIEIYNFGLSSKAANCDFTIRPCCQPIEYKDQMGMCVTPEIYFRMWMLLDYTSHHLLTLVTKLEFSNIWKATFCPSQFYTL